MIAEISNTVHERPEIDIHNSTSHSFMDDDNYNGRNQVAFEYI